MQTVINFIDAGNLQQVTFKDAKEFKSFQNAYWKALLEAMNKKRWQLLFGSSTAPTDNKEEVKS